MYCKKISKILLLVASLGIVSCAPSNEVENSSVITSNEVPSIDVTDSYNSNSNSVPPSASSTSNQVVTKKELNLDFVTNKGIDGLSSKAFEGEFKKGDVVFESHGVYNSSNYLMIKTGKFFNNKTNLGRITSISFETTKGMSASANFEISVSKTADFASKVIKYSEIPGISASKTISFETDENYGFVCFTSTQKNVQLSSLTIKYEIGEEGGYEDSSVPDISIPDSSEVPSTPDITPDISEDVPSDSDNKPGVPEGLNSYYGSESERQNLMTMRGSTLKTKLHRITDATNKVGGYKGLVNSYRTTDVRDDGTIWDMYGEYHFQFSDTGNYKVPGDTWNKEHSIPQSWFAEASPMVSDLWHVYPTDGKINGTRSNYPFGDVDDSVPLDPIKVGQPVGKREGNEFGRLDSKWSGYRGAPSTVFEPREEYKGDFARTYFMMSTLYENKIAEGGFNRDSNKSDNSKYVFVSNSYPSMTDYSINLFMKWAKDDPVSQKEINRNEEVYKIQGSRNPFIDYPAFADMIWESLVH